MKNQAIGKTADMELDPIVESGPVWFLVMYFDGHCGRIRTQEFDTRPEAEHFARCRLRDEDDWAVVDEVRSCVKSRAA
jgi:hypothetical protein